MLIVELDGPQADVEAETAAVRQIAKDAGAFEIREAADADDRAAIWRGRKAAFAAMGRISPAYIVQDGVVPRTALHEVLDRISALSAAAGLRVANVFHAGDGNLHPLVLFDDADPAQAEAAEELSGAILDECISHGGSITGEHGVGVDKSKYMSAHVQRRRSRHHATAPLRVRPGGPVQSRQDLPDPATVRRSPRGQAGASPARHVRADRPFLKIKILIGRKFCAGLLPMPAADSIPAQLDASLRPGQAGRRRLTPSAGVQPRLVAAPAVNQSGQRRTQSGRRTRADRDPARHRLQDRLGRSARTRRPGHRDDQAGPGDRARGRRSGRLRRSRGHARTTRQRPRRGRSATRARRGRTGTVGGVLATGVAGPLRLRYGSPRDLLIGITIVRADGTVARSGGKVVKNVAGYDLGKLFAGSRGTLGLITEATFRLHPIPQSTAYVTTQCDSPHACELLLAAALAPPVAPVAAELSWPQASAPIALGVALEGDPAGVAQRATLLSELLAKQASQAQGSRPASVVSVSDSPPPWWRSGPAAQPDGTVLQLAFWPGELVNVLTRTPLGRRTRRPRPRRRRLRRCGSTPRGRLRCGRRSSRRLHHQPARLAGPSTASRAPRPIAPASSSSTRRSP